MTDSNHPITPPPELVQQWCYEDGDEIRTSPRWYRRVCAKAARWGADQELEACCALLLEQGAWPWPEEVTRIRAVRRPRTLSLKKQALQALENADGSDHPVVVTVLNADQHALIRRALESLSD